MAQHSVLAHLASALHQFESVDGLCGSLLNVLSSSIGARSLGLYVRSEGEPFFYLAAGVRYPEDLRPKQVLQDNDLILWLKKNACALTVSNLDGVANITERIALDRSLRSLGAQVVIPLFGRSDLIGWLSFGAPWTTPMFAEKDMEELIGCASLVAVLLDNAILHRDLCAQREFTDKVLESIPVGVVAIGSSGVVRGFNVSAGKILDLPVEKTRNAHVHVVGSRLSDLLLRCAGGEAIPSAQWDDPLTGRPLSIQPVPLGSDRETRGAVAVVRDLTEEQLLQSKQVQLERKTFWLQLANAMGHEIRNPMQPIKTFLQCSLQGGYDAASLASLGEVAGEGLRQLEDMIKQLESFANRAEPAFAPVRLDDILNEAINVPQGQGPGRCEMALKIPEAIITVHADRKALVDGFRHLISNAIEALAEVKEPRIEIAVGVHGSQGERVAITIKDNGAGLPNKINADPFSLFATTKRRADGSASHIGLGLAIARRAVADHGGKISISSGTQGTCVSVTLPARSR